MLITFVLLRGQSTDKKLSHSNLIIMPEVQKQRTATSSLRTVDLERQSST